MCVLERSQFPRKRVLPANTVKLLLQIFSCVCHVVTENLEKLVVRLNLVQQVFDVWVLPLGCRFALDRVTTVLVKGEGVVRVVLQVDSVCVIQMPVA